MGRQIMFHMLPEDCRELASFLTRHDPVIFTPRDSDSPEITAVTDPCAERRAISIWNQSLSPELSREYIADAKPGPYYRVGKSQPVLEFSPSHLTDWEGTPALLQGRIWGAFKVADRRYAAWFDAITRWIRKNYTKNDSMEGYVAPAARAWHGSGGLLLPMFKPPANETWRAFFESQLAGTKTCAPQ